MQAEDLPSHDNSSDFVLSNNPELIIHPYPLSNIARFFGGVRDGIGNVRSERVNVANKPSVFLLTMRPVKLGERLQYNYNADVSKLGPSSKPMETMNYSTW